MKKDLTLLLLRREGQILLAMKKRGFGEGRWNGVGGKVEPGESILQAAVRECQEEIGVTPHDLRLVGDVDFFEVEDPEFNHHVRVFVTETWDGEPVETEEMRPKWFDLTAIPYDDMWPDDHLWLPLLLDNKKFMGTFTFEHGGVKDYQLDEVTSLPEEATINNRKD